MEDFISKGTGDSRYLKSVSDFLQRYPTYPDMVAALTKGTLPVDFNGINPAGVERAGTPMSKANLLSDATAMSFELDPVSATPDKIFSEAKKLIDFANQNASSRAKFQTGSRVGNGKDTSSGVSAHVEIRFSAKPHLFFIMDYGRSAFQSLFGMFFVDTLPPEEGSGGTWMEVGANGASLDGNERDAWYSGGTLRFNSDFAPSMFNESGVTYKWVAI